MEAALRVLKENPFSDEAVFAALGIIAKHANTDEFTGRRREVWDAIGGSTFMRRLLQTDEFQSIALNVISVFCEDEECGRIIAMDCSTELLSACENCGGMDDPKTALDICKCLRGLKDLTGTARFLLHVMNRTSDDNLSPRNSDIEISREMKWAFAEAFATTQDAFFLASDIDDAFDMLEVDDGRYLAQLARGIANRLNLAESLTAMQKDHGCRFLEKALRDRTVNESPLKKASIFALGYEILVNDTSALDRHNSLAILLSVSGSLELRLASKETETVLNAAKIVDRVASWFSVSQFKETGEEKQAMALVNTLTASCAAMSRNIVENVSHGFKSSPHDNNTALNKAREERGADLTTLSSSRDAFALYPTANVFKQESSEPQKVSISKHETGMQESSHDQVFSSDLITVFSMAIASILTLFWMDDPINGTGLRHVAMDTKAIEALPLAIATVDITAVRFIVPLLVHLPPDRWSQVIARPPLIHLVVSKLCSEIHSSSSTRRFAHDDTRFVYATEMLIMLLSDIPYEQGLSASDKMQLQKALETSQRTINVSLGGEIVDICRRSCVLLIKSLVSRNSPSLQGDAKEFLLAADRLLKRHVEIDGNNDVGETDFALLGVALTWTDMRRLCNLVRSECLG